MHQCINHREQCPTCTQAWEALDRYGRERKIARGFSGASMPDLSTIRQELEGCTRCKLHEQRTKLARGSRAQPPALQQLLQRVRIHPCAHSDFGPAVDAKQNPNPSLKPDRTRDRECHTYSHPHAGPKSIGESHLNRSHAHANRVADRYADVQRRQHHYPDRYRHTCSYRKPNPDADQYGHSH